MALADIITAISTQADRDIALIQERSTEKKNAIKRSTDEESVALEEADQKQRDAVKAQIQRKAETELKMGQRKALLKEKREALESVSPREEGEAGESA
jgi:hypothetical protein